MEKKERNSKVMKLAWQFVKLNGFSMSEAMVTAWENVKLKESMKERIVKFYYRKVDGSMREAYGTLKAELLPPVQKPERKRPVTVQVYYDTERQEYRSFKKANIVKIQ